MLTMYTTSSLFGLREARSDLLVIILPEAVNYLWMHRNIICRNTRPRCYFRLFMSRACLWFMNFSPECVWYWECFHKRIYSCNIGRNRLKYIELAVFLFWRYTHPHIIYIYILYIYIYIYIYIYTYIHIKSRQLNGRMNKQNKNMNQM